MLKFFAKQLYIHGFKHGVKRGFKEGYKRGAAFSSKVFIKLSPRELGVYLDIYNEIEDFAVKVNQTSFNKYNPPSSLAGQNILSRGCLYKIGERAVVLHNSVLSLCKDGWASVVPVILRTLVDCLMNSLAIVSKDSEYMAFKFYVHDYLNLQLDKNISHEVKSFNMNQINQQLMRLSQQDQQRAKKYIDDFLKRTEPKSYWYKPEYKNAKEILDLCKKNSGMHEIFRVFSMSTHSTFLGSNIFKDQPDKIDINPRIDSKSIKMAMVGSSSLLLEITSVRAQFERLGLDSDAQILRVKKSKLKDNFYKRD